jgi:ribose transport system ATP-binding protein
MARLLEEAHRLFQQPGDSGGWTMTQPLLEMSGVCKRFPGVQALDGAELTIEPGEILAVVGENGAGKSTLMKILSGVCSPDSGTIFMNGRQVQPRDPIHARDELGVSIIYQEFNLATHLSVAENIFLGRLPSRGGFIQYNQLYREAREFLAMLGTDLDPRVPVSSLSVAQQQMVEIAKAISYQASLLIMDEPTAALTSRETDALFQVVRGLRDKRVGIIFITHRLDEIFQIADRVTVMRDGKTVGTRPIGELNRGTVVRMMVGRDLSELYAAKEKPVGKPLLEVEHLSVPSRLYDVSFQLRAGEILGLFGLLGSGRTELARALFGIGPAPRGQVRVDGREGLLHSPADATKIGLAYVPEDRKQHGLILRMSVRENTTLAVLRSLTRLTLVRPALERRVTDRFMEELDIRTPSREQTVNNLSGGNQQKVVLAKWLASNPRVLFLDEPTRGIDVGAKAEVHSIMTDLAKKGVGILMISSDLPEVLHMSDRILVMHEGRLTGCFSREEATEELIMLAATGSEFAAAGVGAPVGGC